MDGATDRSCARALTACYLADRLIISKKGNQDAGGPDQRGPINERKDATSRRARPRPIRWRAASGATRARPERQRRGAERGLRARAVRWAELAQPRVAAQEREQRAAPQAPAGTDPREAG